MKTTPSQKLESVIATNPAPHDLRPLLGARHYASLMGTGEPSTSPAARRLTKKSLRAAASYLSASLALLRLGRTSARPPQRPQRSLCDRINARLPRWGGQYIKVASTHSGLPEARHTPSESEYKRGAWRTVTHAKAWINVPLGWTFSTIAGVGTLTRARDAHKPTVRCFWVASGRGAALKLTPGLLHRVTGTHAKSARALRSMLRRKAKADALAHLSDVEVLARLRQSRRQVSPLNVSKRAGNCEEGTCAYLARLGVSPDCRASLGALVRLARLKGMDDNRWFMSACRSAALTL